MYYILVGVFSLVKIVNSRIDAPIVYIMSWQRFTESVLTMYLHTQTITLRLNCILSTCIATNKCSHMMHLYIFRDFTGFSTVIYVLSSVPPPCTNEVI